MVGGGQGSKARQWHRFESENDERLTLACVALARAASVVRSLFG